VQPFQSSRFVLREVKKWQSDIDDGRWVGSAAQHLSNVLHISSGICRQSERQGRPPSMTVTMTPGVLMIFENGMR
jgi:hypothetical protein